MKNSIIAILSLIFVLTCMVFLWRSADDLMKDLIFYTLLAVLVIQGFWEALKERKKSHKDDNNKE